jgi:hypothetical protein
MDETRTIKKRTRRSHGMGSKLAAVRQDEKRELTYKQTRHSVAEASGTSFAGSPWSYNSPTYFRTVTTV